MLFFYEDRCSKGYGLNSDLHDPCHLHQGDEFGLHAVGESTGQLRQESLKGPELLQLLTGVTPTHTYQSTISQYLHTKTLYMSD